jgi:hypothetical protein
MTKDEFINSGFSKAFISEYFEDKIYSFYPDKEKLLYIMCNNDEEKQKVTYQQIEKIKEVIQNLGFEYLSVAYLLSCKPQSISAHNHIEKGKRFDFWLDRFAEEFIYDFVTIKPINEIALEYSKQKMINEKVFEDEADFWEFYPNTLKPKLQDFINIFPKEYDIENTIEYDIEEYRKNEYWVLDFEEYKNFIDVSKPIETLFNLSELFVQLYRLEMFNDFLIADYKTIIKKQQTKTSYKWNSNPDTELPELYNLMINKYKLIASETTYEQFKAVFTGQPLDETFKAVNWHQSNASELLYFILKLQELNNIEHNPKRTDYSILSLCFVGPDGSPFTAHWKQLKQNISTNLSTDKQKAIDELVVNF